MNITQRPTTRKEMAEARIQEASTANEEAKMHAGLAMENLKRMILVGHDAGATWAEIGAIIGMSPQHAFDMATQPPSATVPRSVPVRHWGLDVATFAERTGRSIEEVQHGVENGQLRSITVSDGQVRILSNFRNFMINNS